MKERFILRILLAIVFLLSLFAFQLFNKEEDNIIEDTPRLIV